MSIDRDHSIFKLLAAFVSCDVKAYLDNAEAECTYPVSLLARMSEIGLFGANIPKDYGGLGLTFQENLEVMSELARGWLTLPALLGSHLRVALYFLKCGTPEQQQYFLPRLSAGEVVAAHAYHERGVRRIAEFSVRLTTANGVTVLNGVKDWVTNAQHADIIVTVAFDVQAERPRAVIVNPRSKGVRIGPDLPRPGVKGVSLCTVAFDDYVVNPASDLIGGHEADIQRFIDTNKIGSSLTFASRAVGTGSAVVELCRAHIKSGGPSGTGQEVVKFKFARLNMLLLAMKACVKHASMSLSEDDPVLISHMTKVFCTRTLQDIVSDGVMLLGGAGYASASPNQMDRIYRDAISLTLIDTPNDILLSRVGASLLA